MSLSALSNHAHIRKMCLCSRVLREAGSTSGTSVDFRSKVCTPGSPRSMLWGSKILFFIFCFWCDLNLRSPCENPIMNYNTYNVYTRLHNHYTTKPSNTGHYLHMYMHPLRLGPQYLGTTHRWEQLRSGTYDSLLWKYAAYKFLRPDKMTGEESVQSPKNPALKFHSQCSQCSSCSQILPAIPISGNLVCSIWEPPRGGNN
jgi:hypothetical protein